MKGRVTLLSLIGFAAVAMRGEPARAQESQGSQDLQIFAGEMFGDRLTERPLFDARVRLDDTATFGGRYTYHFADGWGIQLSAGYSPTRAGHAANGSDNLGLTTVDWDLEWDLGPLLHFRGRPIVPYTVIGVGYAWASLDQPIYRLGAGGPVVNDSNGYTANVGLGAKYFLWDNVFIGLDARYRYLSKLVSEGGQGLNTAETTFSVGYRF
jgi:opacity protein-like surface antigen